VGIELGQCGDRWIVGIDLDTCRHRSAETPSRRSRMARFPCRTRIGR
jgi:hypothetical protein